MQGHPSQPANDNIADASLAVTLTDALMTARSRALVLVLVLVLIGLLVIATGTGSGYV